VDTDQPGFPVSDPPAPPVPTAGRPFRVVFENGFVTLLFTAMTILPLTEVLLRPLFGIGVPASASIVQHLTLFIAMFGGAVAAREGRLLSPALGEVLLKGRWRSASGLFSGIVGGAVAAWLAWASVDFLRTDTGIFDIGRLQVPLWVIELVLPAGFGLVALRMLWRSAETWRGRLLAFGVAGLLAAPGLYGLCFGAGEGGEHSASAVLLAVPAPKAVVIAACLLLLAATVLGAPLFAALGGFALILFWGDREMNPVSSAAVEMYKLVVSPFIPTIPLFTLAGYFLSEGGAPRRLVNVFHALFGWLRGGPAIITAMVCAFFTSFTGASGVTILALGGLLLPVLLSARYRERDALGLLTSAGSLGLLFPPSLAVILYGVVAGTPIDMLFLGGLLPGVLLVLLTAAWGVWRGNPRESSEHPFRLSAVGRAVWEAKWELLLPVVVLVGLYGGNLTGLHMTLVEVASVAALYAFVVQTFITRDLRLRRDAVRVVTECGMIVGGVLLILAAAQAFTSYLVIAQIPQAAVEWTRGSIASPLVFLLLLNLVLLVAGSIIDIFSSIIVLVPLLKPLGQAFGIDPVHLGIIFLANMELGFLTPPVGLNLFLSSYRFGKSLGEVIRSVIPMLIVLLVGLMLITYWPWLTLVIPKLFGYTPGAPPVTF
jgi:tripartite ATP-independent transporter DctM subunit